MVIISALNISAGRWTTVAATAVIANNVRWLPHKQILGCLYSFAQYYLWSIRFHAAAAASFFAAAAASMVDDVEHCTSSSEENHQPKEVP